MGISWGIARDALVAGLTDKVEEEGRRLEGVVILRADDDGIGAHLLISAQTIRSRGSRVYIFRALHQEICTDFDSKDGREEYEECSASCRVYKADKL